jgi:hypothetical protein
MTPPMGICPISLHSTGPCNTSSAHSRFTYAPSLMPSSMWANVLHRSCSTRIFTVPQISPSCTPLSQTGSSKSLVASFRSIVRLEGWKEDRGTPLYPTRARNRGEGRSCPYSPVWWPHPHRCFRSWCPAGYKATPACSESAHPTLPNMPNVLISPLHASSPVFILSHVLLVALLPVLTLAQAGSF